MTASADALLDALAAGLRRRADEQRRAEERLASFAFREEASPDGGASPARSGATSWRYHVTRAMRIAGDPAVLTLLEALRGGPLPLPEVSSGAYADAQLVAGDPVAAADWIGALAAAGFVTRELETDRVAIAPLGLATLALVGELERRLATSRQPRSAR